MVRDDAAANVMSKKPEPYQTLEQQIQDLWASRNLEVIEERFRALKHGKYKWTIIAKPKP